MITDFPGKYLATVGPGLRELWLLFPRLALSLRVHYTDLKLTPASPHGRLMDTRLDSVQIGSGENLGAQQELKSLPVLSNVGVLHPLEEMALLLFDISLPVFSLLTRDNSFSFSFLLYFGLWRQGLVL